MNPLEVNSHCGCLADIKHSLLIFIVLLKGWKIFFQILEIKITSAKKWRVGRFPFPDDQPVSESSCNSHYRWNAAKKRFKRSFQVSAIFSITSRLDSAPWSLLIIFLMHQNSICLNPDGELLQNWRDGSICDEVGVKCKLLYRISERDEKGHFPLLFYPWPRDGKVI